MAQTIQIRRGTGSAVPSSLAAGELAINLDSGKLFYGNGSTVSSDFRVNNLTAENYIVCSSVSNITTQTLSGSTQFGDSSDDTHQFTGNVTVTGDIKTTGTNATLRGEKIVIDPHNSVNEYSRIAAYTSGSEDSINVALQLGVDASSSAGNFRGNIANGYGVALSFTSQRDDSSLSTTYETGRISSYLKAGAQGSSDQHGMKFRIRNDDTNIDALTIMPGSPDSDAKIGIMDTTPSYTLDVNGDIRCTDDLFVNDDATITGKLQVNENAIVDGDISASGIVYIDNDIRFSSNHAAIFFDDPGNEYTFGIGQGGLIINAGTTNPASFNHFIVSASGGTTNGDARVGIGASPHADFPLNVTGSIRSEGATIGGVGITSNMIRLTSTTDASATSTGHAFQSGLTSGVNIIIDNNEIMARNNGSEANLHLNADGGSVFFHNNVANSNTIIGASGHITASGNISSSGNIIASNIQDIATTNSPTFAGLTLNPTGEGQTNIISSQAVDLKIATTHASANRDVGIELSGSGAQYSLALDRANGTFVISPSTVGTAPANAKLTLNATGDLSTEGTIKAGWHGSTTRIKILVSDFIPDDVGRPAMIDDTGSDRWLESHGTGVLFASLPIPTGFKATHVHIYGSGTSALEVSEMNINSKTVTSKGTGNIGTELNITDVTSTATNYLLLELAQASGEEVYGGYVTIEAV